MILEVTAEGGLVLAEPFDFKRLSMAPRPGVVLDAAMREGLARHGRFPDDGHFLIPEAGLRALGPTEDNARWQEGVGAMLAYARSRGWVNEQDEVRIHLA